MTFSQKNLWVNNDKDVLVIFLVQCDDRLVALGLAAVGEKIELIFPSLSLLSPFRREI